MMWRAVTEPDLGRELWEEGERMRQALEEAGEMFRQSLRLLVYGE